MKSISCVAAYLLAFSLAIVAAAGEPTQKPKGLLYAKPKLMSGDSIALKWSPTDSVEPGLLARIDSCKIALKVTNIADHRTPGSPLGKCAGREGARTVYSKGDFAAWTKQNIETYAAKQCPEDSGSNAFRIECDIGRFDITEANYYNCSLTVDIAVRNGRDSLLAKQRVAASTKSWGKTFSESEYSKVTSNGVVLLINEILAMEIFKSQDGVRLKQAGPDTASSRSPVAP